MPTNLCLPLPNLRRSLTATKIFFFISGSCFPNAAAFLPSYLSTAEFYSQCSSVCVTDIESDIVFVRVCVHVVLPYVFLPVVCSIYLVCVGRAALTVLRLRKERAFPPFDKNHCCVCSARWLEKEATLTRSPARVSLSKVWNAPLSFSFLASKSRRPDFSSGLEFHRCSGGEFVCTRAQQIP